MKGDEFDYEYGDKPFIHHKPGKWAGEVSNDFRLCRGTPKDC